MIDGGLEQVIPIKENPDMDKFMCISGEEASEWIDQVVEGAK